MIVDKACFQHNMAYGNFKYLARRTASGKGLRVKAFNIGTNPKYDGYQRGLNFLVYKFFDKKTADGAIKNEIKQDEKLAQELHKPTNHNSIAQPEKYIHCLEIIFGMLILQICN